MSIEISAFGFSATRFDKIVEKIKCTEFFWKNVQRRIDYGYKGLAVTQQSVWCLLWCFIYSMDSFQDTIDEPKKDTE